MSLVGQAVPPVSRLKAGHRDSILPILVDSRPTNELGRVHRAPEVFPGRRPIEFQSCDPEAGSASPCVSGK
jgi:hypothetical protein